MAQTAPKADHDIFPETTSEELERRFSDVRGNPIMEELMAAAKKYLMQKGQIDDSK